MTERANVLIVDDRPDKHVVYTAILEDLGQNLVHVDSGQDALKEVLKREFAVILLDVNMPGIGGLETAALIRRRKRSAHVPVIFITAEYGEEARIAQGYALGAVDFMVSPISPDILRSKVKVFVDLYLLAQSARRQAEEHVTLATERAARAAAERASRRSAFMADASAALGQSLEVMAASRELPRLAIPFLADVTALTLRSDDGVEARTEIAWVDRDPSRGLRTESVPEVSCAWWRQAIDRVIETGCSERFDGTSPAVADGSSTRALPGPLEIPSGSAISSLVVLPLRARGRMLGALSLGLGASPRTFDADELAMASDLANRAAMALDNALLYRTICDEDRRKNEFLAMLAHELRNPLTPITNALYIMDHQQEDTERVAWAREVIARQTRLLGRLVDDLLDVSRITQGKIALKVEAVDVAEVVATAVETARPLIEARKHRLTVSNPGSLRIHGDGARMAQVLANLLNNSAKYTEPGGSISLSAAGEGSDIVFRVRDNGMGIPADSLSSIFDLFTQADRTLDRSQGGLGIGLTLVKRLVEMQGGSVSAHSDGHNRGSEFIVRMPAAAPADAQAPAAAGVERRRRGAPRKCRILVVDDNRDAAESMAVLLRSEGHVVHVAYDGPSALDALPAVRPHAVLLDVGLPGIDGYQVAERIRQMPDGAHILLIAISGYSNGTHWSPPRQSGFDRHFVKPIDPVAITELLAAGRRPAAQSIPASEMPVHESR